MSGKYREYCMKFSNEELKEKQNKKCRGTVCDNTC